MPDQRDRDPDRDPRDWDEHFMLDGERESDRSDRTRAGVLVSLLIGLGLVVVALAGWALYSLRGGN